MNFLDLTGRRFGKLVVLRRQPNQPPYGQARWLVRCDCGTEKTIFGYTMVHFGVKSCGCYAKEHPARFLHGMNGTREYHSWVAMRGRCLNKRDKSYHLYGDRGIQICERWSSFQNFYADMGKRPLGMTLDRIDNDGPYSPDNCRWATRQQQVRNRRTTVFYRHNGMRLSLQAWAEKIGVPYQTLWVRYKVGKRGERLLSSYVRPGGRFKKRDFRLTSSS